MTKGNEEARLEPLTGIDKGSVIAMEFSGESNPKQSEWPILIWLGLSLGALPALPLDVQAGPAAYHALRHFGGDFTLTDHNGQPFSLADARGKVVLIFFGFTSCADTCPLILAQVAAVMRELGSLAERVLPLFISVDPKRDTLEGLSRYVQHFHPSIVALTGTQEAISGVARQYRAPLYMRKPDSAGFYVVDHSAKLYVVNTEGTLANILSFGTPPEKIVRVVKDLLARQALVSGRDNSLLR